MIARTAAGVLHEESSRLIPFDQYEPLATPTSIASALPQDDPARKVLAQAATAQAQAALVHVPSGNYEGEHWLASFAVYLLGTPSP